MVSTACRTMRCMSAEDRDLHSDLIAAYRQINHLSRVLDAQTEFISVLLDRRNQERRNEPGGIGAVAGIDRRFSDRREL